MLHYFSGDNRGTGMTIEVSIKHKKGSDNKIYKASSDRDFDFTQWFKVAVRIQDTESIIRIYLNDMAKPLAVNMLFGIAPFPADTELRLAQVYEVFQESEPKVRRRFKVRLMPC